MEKGFHQACEDLAPEQRFVVFPGSEHFPLQHGVEAVPLQDLGRAMLDEASCRKVLGIPVRAKLKLPPSHDCGG
ncbi:hypothetical protein D3227_31060 [Mesorhizobium waimense]|uniref:Uncharacterized protein n=1 Tax=Mesorhizobium waimense TaxID=1300307 RepID=A0A3A5K4E4_9HYPH|nr:hypothetical protein D3227_31060 [Mesorhizobium waimense]